MLDVAEEVFKRCAVSNEDEVNKDDMDFTITFNYEFLEDFVDEETIGGRLTRALTLLVPVCYYLFIVILYYCLLFVVIAYYINSHRRNVPDELELQSEYSGTDETVSVLNDTATLAKETGFTTNWGPKGYDKTNHCLHLLVS